MQQEDLAIVLKSIRYEERDRIVTAITQNHGKITALARNSVHSRRFGATLEPLCVSSWKFQTRPGSDLAHLQETELKQNFPNIPLDFDRYTIASAASEVLLKLTSQGSPCVELFRLFSHLLVSLNVVLESEKNLSLLCLFLAKTVHWSGSLPDFNQCNQCSQPPLKFSAHDRVYCLVETPSFVCMNCAEKSQLSAFATSFQISTLAGLKKVIPFPLTEGVKIWEINTKEKSLLIQYLEKLLIFHVPGFDRTAIKSLRFLKSNSPHPLANLQ